MIARKKTSALSVAVVAFCILHSAFCIAVPASAYIQDGLVACWDGKYDENLQTIIILQ